MSSKQHFERAWRIFVDTCSAWPWLKVLIGLAAGAIMWLYGWIAQLPGPYVAALSLFASACAIWIWNQIAIRKYLAGMHLFPSLPLAASATKPMATAAELAEPRIAGRTLRIYDVQRSNDVIVSDRVFEDCDILGPAIVGAIDEVTMLDECEWGVPSLDARVYWKASPGQQLVGIIGLQRCVLRRCRFFNVGFCGPKQFIRELKQRTTYTSR